MKSVLRPEAVTFGALQTRLIRFVNNRISNGDFSERGLARILQISQPQLHNVLKGARKLTPELADHVMQCFGITVLDLLENSELSVQLTRPPDSVPLIRMQSRRGHHLESRCLSEEQEIPKKGPGRESSPDEFDLTGIA
ncbi:MAG TPA: hypothetical protein VFA65_06550 [Bryobacteraceae bacterium]|nr:hypothetical protein [Bryobacteraceae bacterium]